jgi:hypothetical protein
MLSSPRGSARFNIYTITTAQAQAAPSRKFSTSLTMTSATYSEPWLGKSRCLSLYPVAEWLVNLTSTTPRGMQISSEILWRFFAPHAVSNTMARARRAVVDDSLMRPPCAPRPPRGRVVPEWRAPWLQDPQHRRPHERELPVPEFDDEVERYLYLMRNRSFNLMGGGN